MTNFENTVQALRNGEVIAYPTEGVFGVGCDPDNAEAIQKLLELKKRPVEKGLILIASNFEQLKPYVDESRLTEDARQAVFATWPGPITWVMPAKAGVSPLLCGHFDSIAVRVTDHPLVQKLCDAFAKPLTSTSANLTGQPPCRTSQEVRRQLDESLVAILEGETGGRDKPSEIRDALTSTILRQG